MTDDHPPTSGFEAVRGDFDRLGTYLWRPIGAALTAATAPGPGDRVLDACAGNGASAIPAASAVGPTGWVDAVDLAHDLISELRDKAAELDSGHAPVHTHLADVTEWEPDGYEVVQCALGVFFFPDMEGGTEYLISRARPGGRVGIAIWRRESIRTAGWHLRDAVGAVTGEELGPRPATPIDRIDTVELLTPWLHQRGLRQVKVVEYRLRVPLTPDVAWLLVTGSGFAQMLTGLDAEQIEQVRIAYLASLRDSGLDLLEATTLIGTGIRL